MKRVTLLFLPLVACTLPGKVSEEDLNKTMECTDTRDGEMFRFRAADAEFRVGIGSAEDSMTVADLDGVKRTFTESNNDLFKCEEVAPIGQRKR